MNETDSNDWLDDAISTDEAATLIGITPRWVRELVKQDKLKGKHISPRILVVSRKSVEEYIREVK